jgi:hypothetical protein
MRRSEQGITKRVRDASVGEERRRVSWVKRNIEQEKM